MDSAIFDRWTRTLTPPNSRRQALKSLALGLLGLGAAAKHVAAGPGCKNVGKQCKKKKDCCSGVCKGKKGKKKCKAHDTGGCQAGQIPGFCEFGTNTSCTTASGEDGVCNTTTGNAGYCALESNCFPCTKDADCRTVCGPAAACLVCAVCAEEGGTACGGPGDCEGL